MPHRRFSQQIALAFGLAMTISRAAQAEVSVAGSGLLSGDEWGFRLEEYGLDVGHTAEASGQRLALRWYRYALTEELEGILPFSGHEPAAEVGAHVLQDLWWLSAAAGVQGTLDIEGVTGELTVARAIPDGRATFTPRMELAREPLAMTALPLSLGLLSHRAQAALEWRVPGVVAEGGARADFWEGDTVVGRVRNSARDRISALPIITGYAYVVSDGGGWLDAGLTAKVAAASRNTLLATQLSPERHYTWYPASAPPFVWETSAVLRLHGELAAALQAKLQLQLPLVSQETRQWESVQVTSWGTAPYEAQLDIEWFFLAATSLQLMAKLFTKPWQSWDALSDGAYRQASVRVAVEQRI
jgi:hypothetical protein